MEKETSTKIYGLIGYPVKHSLSPAMHNAAFRFLEINAEYRLFEVKPKDLKFFLLENISVKDTEGKSFFSQDIAGFNITIPHKIQAREILHGRPINNQQDHYVFLSGAINTVKKEKNEVQYANTDSDGFMRSLKEDLKFNTEDKNVFIFGCGGAGRAIVAALTWKDAKINKIYLYDISQEALISAKKHFSRFDFVKSKLEFISSKQTPEKIRDCHLLVNASPVGMKEGDSLTIDKRLFHKDLSVYDVVYNKETQLIKNARSLGLPAVNGLGMLLYQGMLSFEIWTGEKAPKEIMQKALLEGLK